MVKMIIKKNTYDRQLLTDVFNYLSLLSINDITFVAAPVQGFTQNGEFECLLHDSQGHASSL